MRRAMHCLAGVLAVLVVSATLLGFAVLAAQKIAAKFAVPPPRAFVRVPFQH